MSARQYPVPFGLFVRIFREAGYEPRSYSGRGMYGKECLAVVCDDPFNMLLDMVDAFAKHKGEVFTGTDDVVGCINDLVVMMRNPSTDNMGHSTIVYWKHIVWEASS